MDKRLIGEYGEIVAARYLRKHGYIIVEGNYHCKFGEIDIVAEDKKYVVFVEVKTRSTGMKYSPSDADSDDLISIGSIGLIKAVSSYRPDKKTKLGTYAVRCISNEILMFLRADKKHQSEVSLQDSIGNDSEGNEITFMELLSTDDKEFIEDIEKEMRNEDLRHKINRLLKGRERLIIELRYGLINDIERTQHEIGKMLGISRSYVSRIEKKALKKLKIAME